MLWCRPSQSYPVVYHCDRCLFPIFFFCKLQIWCDLLRNSICIGDCCWHPAGLWHSLHEDINSGIFKSILRHVSLIIWANSGVRKFLYALWSQYLKAHIVILNFGYYWILVEHLCRKTLQRANCRVVSSALHPLQQLLTNPAFLIVVGHLLGVWDMTLWW